MCRASVLIPTHEHAATLPFAVASVQAQGIDDIEILIVGDGVNDELRAIVERLRADDARIKFFDFPKGPRNGEMHRDGVVRQAARSLVARPSGGHGGGTRICRLRRQHDGQCHDRRPDLGLFFRSNAA
jgi:glycosyltransferase involved in cell wall biosynthesis